MQNVRYDYSSVHVDVPMPLAAEIVAWGRDYVSDDDIFVSQKDPTYGREDEIHITLLYGLHTDVVQPVYDLLHKQGPVRVKLGVTDVFSNPFKFDVLIIHAISPDLTRLNDRLRSGVQYTNRYGGYNPHVTIAYVKKGKGWKHGGLDMWEGREFMCDYAVFSSKNGFKERITL